MQNPKDSQVSSWQNDRGLTASKKPEALAKQVKEDQAKQAFKALVQELANQPLQDESGKPSWK